MTTATTKLRRGNRSSTPTTSPTKRKEPRERRQGLQGQNREVRLVQGRDLLDRGPDLQLNDPSLAQDRGLVLPGQGLARQQNDPSLAQDRGLGRRLNDPSLAQDRGLVLPGQGLGRRLSDPSLAQGRDLDLPPRENRDQNRLSSKGQDLVPGQALAHQSGPKSVKGFSRDQGLAQVRGLSLAQDPGQGLGRSLAQGPDQVLAVRFVEKLSPNQNPDLGQDRVRDLRFERLGKDPRLVPVRGQDRIQGITK